MTLHKSHEIDATLHRLLSPCIKINIQHTEGNYLPFCMHAVEAHSSQNIMTTVTEPSSECDGEKSAGPFRKKRRTTDDIRNVSSVLPQSAPCVQSPRPPGSTTDAPTNAVPRPTSASTAPPTFAYSARNMPASACQTTHVAVMSESLPVAPPHAADRPDITRTERSRHRAEVTARVPKDYVEDADSNETWPSLCMGTVIYE